MERQVVECLSCGHQRVIVGDPGECPRCRYVGWAAADDLSETVRRSLRDRPLGVRGMVPAHERKAS